MKALTFALALSLAASSAGAEIPTTLPAQPENGAYCLGGGGVVAAIASGVSGGVALVAVGLCAIIVHEIRWIQAERDLRED